MDIKPSEIKSNDLGYIHRWVPGNSDTTLVLLHGTGGDENDLLTLGKSLSPYANLVSPRGNVLEDGRYNRFFRRLAEGVFDIDDLIFRSGELAGFIRAASEHYEFDRSKVSAVGFSNGANMAASIILLYPDVFTGAVLFSPMKGIEPQTSPNLVGKRVFIGAGEFDPIASPQTVNELGSQFESYGALVTTKFYQMGHRIAAEEIDNARDWLANVSG